MRSLRFGLLVRLVLLVAGLFLCSSGACVEVTLISPADQSVVNDTTVTFVCSAADEVGLSSATLYIGNPPQTLTFSGPDETDDAQIYAGSPGDPDTNYGTATSINVDGENPHAHAVIKFLNVFGEGEGQVPPGSSIVSATLKVNCFNSGNMMRLYRLTEDWVESEVTWNQRQSGLTWSDAGADGAGSNAGVALDGDCTSTGWRTLDITLFAQEWSDGAQNYGIVMTDTGSDGVDFDTSETANPPVLSVTYQTKWLEKGSQTLSGTSATVVFENVELADQEEYTWNCLVANASNPPEESWAPADFRLTVDTHCPDQPALVAPADEATGVPTSPTLEVTVSDPDLDSLNVDFYGRGGSGEEFTIIALPDTQKYVLNAAHPEIFTSQTQWVVGNIATRNIVFVTHEGDIVDTWNNQSEWNYANTSMSILDGVVPYGVLPGNHDMSSTGVTTYYNETFPYTRYDGQPWYGGHYPTTGNDNNYQLFSAGGEDYIIVHLQYAPTSDVFGWANGVLAANADRKAIITTHDYMETSGARSTNGENIWTNVVVPNANVYVVLCGHNHDEATRSDWVGDRRVHQLLADYQDRSNGGDGWLRIMRFVPAEDTVYVQTYSPWLDQYETDANSQFTLDFPMGGFSVIGSDIGVPSGSDASVVWPGLSVNTLHEWYVTVTDPSSRTQTGPVWQFTTASDDTTPPVISDVDAVDITDTSARIVWTTDEPADSLVQYWTAEIPASEVSDASLVTSHSITLTGLTPNATYYYQVTSKDSSGNSATDSGHTFTTLQEPPPVYDYATADYAVEIGSIAGDYQDTWYQDEIDQSAEALTEAVREQGKPSKRHDELSHIWTFDVTGGNSLVFHVDACKTASPDGDDFVFSYSTDGVSYTDMLTVTKTTDNHSYQTYALPSSLMGIVYVRAQDTDRSAGNQNLDTLYVDEMYILCSGSPPDLPPDAPQNLVAVGGDTVVSLDWDDNPEQDQDFAGYNVYRSTGGQYGKVNLDLLARSDYVDTGLTNGITYYYMVTALDAAGQESGFSNQASATPGVSTVMHVEDIAMSTVSRGKNWSAVATVTVLDEANNPVEGANVSYIWSEVHGGSGVGLTGPDGTVTVTSEPSKSPGTTTFTVTDVQKAGCTYDPSSNVMTSASVDGP